jgi:hypothetical protein
MTVQFVPLVARGASAAAPGGLSAAPALDSGWVEQTRRAAVVVFPALVVFSLLAPGRAGRVFWTIAIACLPLFFVIAGYHRWRRICPLAFIAQLSTRMSRPGRRRAGKWLQAHAYHVSFAVLFGSLWLRLVATNGDGYLLAMFLVAISVAALATDALFTGKTWCNYVCPISFVEKIYTEPRNLRATPNSQCQKCTACKPACPDINEENSYWKEILHPAKRDVYFSFPGLVLAFYGFYYLQAGSWDYYFGGRWTNQIGLIRTAFLPGSDARTAGFFFWPAVPRAAAAVITLLLGAACSLSLFSLLERPFGRWLIKNGRVGDEAGVRHIMFTLAAFTAFVTFYSFAGAPTLRLLPGLPHIFQLLVVTTATLFLVRRFRRRHNEFVEETLARQIIAKWPWTDAPAPRDLREAFLVHRIRSQSHDEARSRAIELYKEAVRDTVHSGIISRVEVHHLETIRDQMHISQADHERVMTELADEDRGLDPALIVSPEKHLQLETYAQGLALHLARWRTAAGAVDDAAIRALRHEYGVTEQEHAAVLDRLVRRNEGIAAHLVDVPAAIEMSVSTVQQLELLRSPAARFLALLLVRRSERAADGLLRAIGSDSPEIRAIRSGLLSGVPADRRAALAALGSRVSPAIAARLNDAQHRAQQQLGGHPDLAASLRNQFASPDPYIRAAALYTLESIDAATESDYAALDHDEHAIVQETVTSGRRFAAGQTIRVEPTTLAKMIGLKSIAIFEGLQPEDLAELARAGKESWFTQGETLCREGELGDELFVLLDGEVSVLVRDGDVDRVVAIEGPGSVIGELAVLDPAPRNASVVASTVAVRALCLAGGPFRQALNASPAVSEVIIRMLARRLRAQNPSSKPVADSTLQRR